MAMRKRGIVFTLMAIIVITIVLFTVRPATYAPMEQRIPVIGNRVGVANEHLYSLENIYLKRVLVHSGYRAFNAYIRYMNLSGDEPADSNELTEDFFEIITNNSVNGVNISGPPYSILLVDNNTLTDKLVEFSNLSKEFLNIVTNVSVLSVQLKQDDNTGPWSVALVMNSTIFLNGSIAIWNRGEHNTTTTVSIVGIEDYLYLRNTRALQGGPYKNYIYPTNITTWNLTKFSHHMGNRTYKHDPEAPNFLSRLYNNYNASECCGIESIIYQGWDMGAYKTNMSFIDYCYFSQLCNGSNPDDPADFSLHNLTGVTSDTYPFKIEAYHFSEERYNLTYEEGLLVPD